jgi:hypothetical protein
MGRLIGVPVTNNMHFNTFIIEVLVLYERAISQLQASL